MLYYKKFKIAELKLMKKNVIYEYKSVSVTVSKDSYLTPTPHFHKEIEIIYVKEGACTAYADRKLVTLESGDLYIAFPNQIHYYENCIFGEYYVIIANSSIFFELKDVFNNSVPTINKYSLKEHIYLTQLMDSLVFTQGKYKNTIISGILNQSIGLILPEIKLNPRIKTDNSTLQAVLAFCAEHFYEDITLDSVSESLHLSKYHISHLLNQKLGISFNSYINMLRIDKACDLLEETDKKTADISEDVGFGSIRTFNRAFLQISGITPLKYRNRYKILQEDNIKDKIIGRNFGNNML